MRRQSGWGEGASSGGSRLRCLSESPWLRAPFSRAKSRCPSSRTSRVKGRSHRISPSRFRDLRQQQTATSWTQRPMPRRQVSRTLPRRFPVGPRCPRRRPLAMQHREWIARSTGRECPSATTSSSSSGSGNLLTAFGGRALDEPGLFFSRGPLPGFHAVSAAVLCQVQGVVGAVDQF